MNKYTSEVYRIRILTLILILQIFGLSSCNECKDKIIEKKFFSNGKVMEEFETCNGIKDGICKEYYQTGILKKSYHFENGKPSFEKLVKNFYPNGKKNYNLTISGGDISWVVGWDSLDNSTITKGTGKVIDFDTAGNQISEMSFLDGKLHDTLFVWHPNTELNFIHIYSNGKSIRLKKWDVDGNLILDRKP